MLNFKKDLRSILINQPFTYQMIKLSDLREEIFTQEGITMEDILRGYHCLGSLKLEYPDNPLCITSDDKETIVSIIEKAINKGELELVSLLKEEDEKSKNKIMKFFEDGFYGKENPLSNHTIEEIFFNKDFCKTVPSSFREFISKEKRLYEQSVHQINLYINEAIEKNINDKIKDMGYISKSDTTQFPDYACSGKYLGLSTLKYLGLPTLFDFNNKKNINFDNVFTKKILIV